MENSKDVNKLLAKQLLGTLTETEKEQLDNWVKESPRHQALYNRLQSDHSLLDRYEAYHRIDSRNAWKRFERNCLPQRTTFKLYKLLRYAAIFLLPLLLAAGVYYYFGAEGLKQESAEIIEHFPPGTSKAILSLPNNVQHVLAPEAMSDTAIKVGTSTSAVTQSGRLVYSAQSSQRKSTDENNVLTTERGNEFHVTFEDGTSVHLNYNTELSYPVKFDAKSRTVYLKGEAYFNIAKDSRPFYVVTEEGTIKQYGTEFNVNTFTPGRTEVALVRGSVSIISSPGAKEQRLAPGQLAYCSKNNQVSIHNVDITPYIAWNDGRLIFEDRPLESIMRTLELWYNVEVDFDTPELKQLRFTGNMDRYGTITPILRAIARTSNLHFEIQDRKIWVIGN